MVGCHHRLNGHQFEKTLGDGEGQGSLKSMELQRVRNGSVTEQHPHMMISDGRLIYNMK